MSVCGHGFLFDNVLGFLQKDKSANHLAMKNR